MKYRFYFKPIILLKKKKQFSNESIYSEIDGITTKHIKLLCKYFFQPLVHNIANKILEKGTFSNVLNLALIKPVFKKMIKKRIVI